MSASLEPSDSTSAPKPDQRTVALRVAYEGTQYAGWQIQPDALSVQQVVTEAVARLTGTQVVLRAASRTDSGVHAFGQVAAFTTASTIPARNIRRALQQHLPTDVAITAVREAAPDFHPTYDAVRKRYRYVIDDAGVPDPFSGRFTWPLRQRLDDQAMHAAGQALLGRHDFRCFESHFPNKATSIRTIEELAVRRVSRPALWSRPERLLSPEGGSEADIPGGADDLIVLEVAADGFLYNMVRAIAGTLVDIGRGRWPVEYTAELITAQDRSKAGPTAPASGLTLVSVEYPEHCFLSDWE